MGRPAKLLELHELQGTVPQSKSSALSNVPAGRPKFPKDLGPELKPVFKNLCGLLEQRRALTAADGELIRLYCFVFDRHKRNVALLREEGEIVTYTRLDSNGQPVPQVRENLRVKLCTRCEQQMASILSQLGLTVTAKDRARPTTKNPGKHEVVKGSVEELYPEYFGKEADEQTETQPDYLARGN